MSYYAPGTQEKDLTKIIMSLQQAHSVAAGVSTRVVGPGTSTDNAAARFDGTGGYTVQNSALIIADTTGGLSRSGNGGIPLQGTNTNDSAAAGYVGEYIESSIASGSAVSLTSTVAANVTSISLTAGDWDVTADVTYSPAATTNFTLAFHSISSTSATQDSTTGGAYNVYRFPAGNVPVAGFNTAGVGPVRKLLSATTTIYLVAQSTFTVSTMAAYGILRARRVR